MRELRVRAWIEDEKRMVDSPRLDLAWSPPPGSALMEFTGLYDKNGIPIYEGDILKITCEKLNYEGIGEIRYCPERLQFEVIGIICDFKFFGKEVIGNIYQTPELLQRG